MYEKCPRCQQKAMEDEGYCGACGWTEEDFEHPPLNPFDPLGSKKDEYETVIPKEHLGEFLRKACQAGYCMERDEMCEIVYGTPWDEMPDCRQAYMKSKFDILRKDFLSWVCQLDTAHLQAFADYVMNKEA